MLYKLQKLALFSRLSFSEIQLSTTILLVVKLLALRPCISYCCWHYQRVGLSAGATMTITTHI